MKTCDIQISDPFILPDIKEQTYYLFGTTDKNGWEGAGVGFDCFKSKDLVEWEGPIPAFLPPRGFWGTENFWAPEWTQVHNGAMYAKRLSPDLREPAGRPVFFEMEDTAGGVRLKS